MERERLGIVVRATWINWAREQPNPKASWLVPWELMEEADKEADRRIGETIEEVVRDEYEPVILDLVEMCQIALQVLDVLDSRQSYSVTKQNLKLAIERGMRLFPSSSKEKGQETDGLPRRKERTNTMPKSQAQIEREIEELQASVEWLEIEKNQLSRLLAECSMMLENSMAPYIDAPDVNRWIEERRTLLEEIRRTLNDGNHYDEESTEEVC